MTDSPGDAPVDLDNCAREQIQFLGHVQPYGCLLAVSRDWVIDHASANTGDMLGHAAETLIGTDLAGLFARGVLHDIRGRLQMLGHGTGAARIYGIEPLGDGRVFDMSVHLSGAHYLFELEPKDDTGTRDEMSLVQPLIARVRRRPEIVAMAREAARAMKALTGFDRVMIYQFQRDDSGRVIAEAAAPGLAPFLGLRFPASDIPPQARALYERNPIRLIRDVDAAPQPILPALDAAGQRLDLSLSVTRAVSPIHLEYLRNMGVAASMSVSILRDGKLWGLIACHHSTPHYVDYQKRSAVELFTQLLSYEIAAVETGAERGQIARARALHGAMLSRMTDGTAIADNFDGIAREIGEVIACDGIALWINDRYHATGLAPTREDFAGLRQHLGGVDAGRVHAIDRLIDAYPASGGFAAPVAGILALPISRGPRDYVVLFRREQVETVTWAGDPAKPAQPGPNGLRLTPRKSFEAWSQTVRHQSAPWSDGDIAAAETLRITLLEVVLKIADDSIAERKRAQERQELMIAELNHRVRNILNLVRSLVSQSRSGAASMDDYGRILDGRIDALARAHDQLTGAQGETASLRGLIETEIDAFIAAHRQRVQITGTDVALAPEAFSALALVLHELVTNAAKYGALRALHGWVEVELTRCADGALRIDWRERGGAPVRPPAGRGFGTTVIERSIPFELGGEADLHFALTGLEARFRIPARFVSADPVRPAPAKSDTARDRAGTAVRLSGRALVVEDNMIIAMDAADILSELGCDDVVTASGVGEALRLIETGSFDLALLDVNLGHETSVPVAEALRARGVPFLLATGYGATDDIAAAYPKAPALKKPYTKGSMRAGFAALLNGAGT
ncbi:HWE histidine kinase domain-containing protein [Limimaricola hongkongensis]|uniref:histidine kinase n=1 Tax=Limimaricola hongkongensis DSM 17492 TaxID=1122180 RepID=A0A017HH18_9RHOB|nr:HWE histidine kinase domain-containing protein [Limimaricola hongkongensis]EYD73059.1 Phytochrome, two-component sensor histidine kinase [Limimaricola hongkongensis DSM 17492]